MNKNFRDVKAGEVFRPVGSPVWRRATEDAKASTDSSLRGVWSVVIVGQPQQVTKTVALGHLQVEVK